MSEARFLFRESKEVPSLATKKTKIYAKDMAVIVF